ncbi:MAG TPA: coproporphyrinogen dehydrogenase HemZ [Bacillota bacterium]|nr:coproporphyrinogen dehydrogenase HemZ [Bacillota bacterium]
MKYIIETQDSRYLPNIEAALKIVDPKAEIVQDGQGVRLIIQVEGVHVSVTAPDLSETGRSWEYYDKDILDPRYSTADRLRRMKELVRLGIIKLLGDFLGKTPPWGILSSVRPTKIYHYLREKGFTQSEIYDKLLSIYGISTDKAELLVNVGSFQERFFKPQEYISVYVGIPFCPSRCHYCSFPAVSLQTHHHWVARYLEGLRIETEAIGELCRSLGFKIESIYIGGGTPTSLELEDFARVLQWTVSAFKTGDTIEFTVEAGRPETVTREKLEAMRHFGVTRMSINPQTMHDRTLALIGRNHTAAQVEAAMDKAKKFDGLLLNMDLILGLPGEAPEDFLDSLEQVIALNPDNITIHTLAPKRAAKWGREFSELNLLDDDSLAEVSDTVVCRLSRAGFHPYYLYRQRRILADLENIGYARPGSESVYNIQMMEERQTIIGVGAGAITKWVVGTEPQISRYQNPKCPATYASRIVADIAKKAHQTRILLG